MLQGFSSLIVLIWIFYEEKKRLHIVARALVSLFLLLLFGIFDLGLGRYTIYPTSFAYFSTIRNGAFFSALLSFLCADDVVILEPKFRVDALLLIHNISMLLISYILINMIFISFSTYAFFAQQQNTATKNDRICLP